MAPEVGSSWLPCVYSQKTERDGFVPSLSASFSFSLATQTMEWCSLQVPRRIHFPTTQSTPPRPQTCQKFVSSVILDPVKLADTISQDRGRTESVT